MSVDAILPLPVVQFSSGQAAKPQRAASQLCAFGLSCPQFHESMIFIRYVKARRTNLGRIWFPDSVPPSEPTPTEIWLG